MDHQAGEYVDALTFSLLHVLDQFRDFDSNALVAAVAAPGGGTYRLTYGNLRDLARAVIDERARANRAAREAADARDRLDTLRTESEKLRQQCADLLIERDVLTMELDEAR
jgi:hypothetical protein